jgi:hypothetical protein
MLNITYTFQQFIQTREEYQKSQVLFFSMDYCVANKCSEASFCDLVVSKWHFSRNVAECWQFSLK